MFTTGSKLFGALGTLTLVVSIVLLNSSGRAGQIVEFWSWFSLAAVFLLVGGLLLAFRDGNLAVADREAFAVAEAESRPITPIVSASPWPVIGAFGLMVSIFGLVLDRRVFVMGIVLMLIALLEWTVQGWSDRASSDPWFNAALRDRIARPFEFPVFGAVIGVFVVVGFSRVLVAVSEVGSVAVFGAVAFVVFVSAIVIASAPRAGKVLLYAALLIGGAGVLVAGIVGAANGERTFEVKTGEEKLATGTVSDKSSRLGTLTIAGNKFQIDAPGGALNLPKATTFNILFRNNDSSRRNLELLGADGKPVAQTDYVEQDQATVLTLRVSKPGTYDLVSKGGSVDVKTVVTVL